MLSKKIITILLLLTIFGFSGLASAKGLDDFRLAPKNSQPVRGDVMVNAKVESTSSTASSGKDRMRLFLTASSSVRADVNLQNKKAEADKMIDKRIESLNKLKSRISGMKKLSDTDKANLNVQVDASIKDLTALKAKIDSDTDAATLKADIASITAGLRIYLLVIPKIEILAAADRISTIVTMMGTIGDKFETRIKELHAAGKTTVSLEASLSDYRAKLVDANVQASAATAAVVSLNPDNGNKTVADANKAALEKAKGLIKTAERDLKVAREDANKILKEIRSLGGASFKATTTVSR